MSGTQILGLNETFAYSFSRRPRILSPTLRIALLAFVELILSPSLSQPSQDGHGAC